MPYQIPNTNHEQAVSNNNIRFAFLVFFHIHPKRLKMIIAEWKKTKKTSKNSYIFTNVRILLLKKSYLCIHWGWFKKSNLIKKDVTTQQPKQVMERWWHRWLWWTLIIINTLKSKIIKAFYKVYNTLGYGFLEKVYENALLFNFGKKPEFKRKVFSNKS